MQSDSPAQDLALRTATTTLGHGDRNGAWNDANEDDVEACRQGRAGSFIRTHHPILAVPVHRDFNLRLVL
jgi:hypothetical protein